MQYYEKISSKNQILSQSIQCELIFIMGEHSKPSEVPIFLFGSQHC
jgi:hypothetical protein